MMMSEIDVEAVLAATPEIIPEISVVMPVYNATTTLEATIRSVLAQSFRWFELVVVDDGSTDSSLGRLLALALEDPRIKVISRRNAGVSSARNLGVQCSSAPLVAFLDADDLWDANKLAYHVALHRDEPDLVASYARIAFIAEDASSLNGARTHSSLCPHSPGLRDVLGENPICTASNLVVRRDWLMQAGGFDEKLSFAEDQDLVARLIARGGRIEGIDAVLTGYRFSPDGLSMDLDRMHAGWRLVVNRYLADADSVPLEALYCRYLARRVLRAGGRPRQALRYVMAGLRLDTNSFMAERRRGLSTVLAAIIAPLLPASMRLRLFA